MAENIAGRRSALERALQADESGTERDALLGRLGEATRAVKQRLDAGAPPQEFSSLDLVSKGLGAATVVAAAVWRRYHKG